MEMVPMPMLVLVSAVATCAHAARFKIDVGSGRKTKRRRYAQSEPAGEAGREGGRGREKTRLRRWSRSGRERLDGNPFLVAGNRE